MSTKTMKILTTILTILLIMSIGTSAVYADTSKGSGSSSASGLTPKGINATYEGTDEIGTIGGKLMGIIRTIAVVIAVLILMVLGIKYMMGSAEEKAEYKKTMIPYVIGAILVFAAGTIANAVYNFANGI